MQMSTMDTETGEMIVKRVSVPIGLEELMEGLTKEILLKKPDDIYLFAAEYFAQLLLLREKGNYKGKPLRTVQSISKQVPKQPPEKLVIRGASKKLLRQISVRGDSPVKRVAPNKKSFVRKDPKEDKSDEKSKFTDRKGKPRNAESAETKNIESKPKQISRTASENTNILNKRDRSVSSSRRGRSITNTVQGTPRQRNTSSSTPRRAQIVENDKPSEPQNKDDTKQETNKNQNKAKEHQSVPKISSVEEDQAFIKDGKLTVTPPKVIKRPQAVDNHELISTLVVPQMVENIASVNQNIVPDKPNKEMRDITSDVVDLPEPNKNKTNSDYVKVPNEQGDNKIENEVYINDKNNSAVGEMPNKINDKSEIIEKATNKELVHHQTGNEVTNGSQRNDVVGAIQNKINADLNDTNSNTGKEIPAFIEGDEFKSESESVSSIDGKSITKSLSNVADKKARELKSVDILEKQDDSHSVNTDNTSDDQNTNLLDDTSASEILDKNIGDAQLLENQTEAEDDDKAVNDESNLTLVSDGSDTMRSAPIMDHQTILDDKLVATSIETQSKAVDNMIVSESDKNKEKKSGKEEGIVDSKTPENIKLDMEINKKTADNSFTESSLKDVVENDIPQKDADRAIKQDKEAKDDKDKNEKTRNGAEKIVLDSKENITNQDSHNDDNIQPNEKDNVKQHSEVDRDKTNDHKHPSERMNVDDRQTTVHTNVVDSMKTENTDHKKEQVQDKIAENSKIGSTNESIEKGTRESQSIERNKENDVNLENKKSEGDKLTEAIRLEENKLKDNSNVEMDENKIGNMKSQMGTKEKENDLKEEKAKQICEHEKSYNVMQENSDSLDKKQKDGTIPLGSNKNHLEDKKKQFENKETPRTTLTKEAIESNKEKIDEVIGEKEKSTCVADTASIDEKKSLKGYDLIHTSNKTKDEKVGHKESNEDDGKLMSLRTDMNVENISINKENTNEPMKEQLIENVKNILMTDKGNTKDKMKEHLVENAKNISNTDKENKEDTLKDFKDDNIASQQDKQVKLTTKIDKIDDVISGTADKNIEETTNSITNDILPKQHKIVSDNISDTINENQNVKKETVLLEANYIPKVDKRNHDKNTLPGKELNATENISQENKQPYSTKSTSSTDNTESSDASNEYPNNAEAHTQEKHIKIAEDQKLASDENIDGNYGSDDSQIDEKTYVIDTPVSKDQNNMVVAKKQNEHSERDIDSVTDPIIEPKLSNNKTVEDNTTLKIHDNIEEDETLKKNSNLNTKEKNNMKDGDTSSILDLAGIDKTTKESKLESKHNEFDIQTRDVKNDHIDGINAVINIAKEGPVDNVVKKYIGDFIQQEQKHVFTKQMESKAICGQSNEPKEVAENILVKIHDGVSANEGNKSESFKVETQKVDENGTKSDVMKNVLNSTALLAETGKVDEILKVHIKDFLSNEKNDVFRAKTGTIDASNDLDYQKQIKTNEIQNDIKEADDKPVKDDNKKKTGSITRKDSSKNLKQLEAHPQKMKPNGKNIKSRSSSQTIIKVPEENVKQNNKNKAEKKLRRVKTVDVITDESKPKPEIKSRIPTADYRNRVKRETNSDKHSVLIKQANSQESVNILPGKAVSALQKIDKTVDSTTDNKKDDAMIKDRIDDSIEDKPKGAEIQQNTEDLKEAEQSEICKSDFDNSKLHEELKAVEDEIKFATFKPTFNPYVLRQEIKNASLLNDPIIDNKKSDNFLAQIAAALKIQAVWRGFKVRKNKAKTSLQQKTEPDAIVENKDAQLVLQGSGNIKGKDITEDNIKPDGMVTEKYNEKRGTAKLGNDKDNYATQLNTEEKQNQKVIESLKAEDFKIPSKQENEINAGDESEKHQLGPQGDANLKAKDTIITDSIAIKKEDSNIKIDHNGTKSNLNGSIKSENIKEQQLEPLGPQKSLNQKLVDHSRKENLNGNFNAVYGSKINEDKFIEAAVTIQKIWRAFKVRKNIKQNHLEQKSMHKDNESLQINTIDNKIDVKKGLGTLKPESERKSKLNEIIKSGNIKDQQPEQLGPQESLNQKHSQEVNLNGDFNTANANEINEDKFIEAAVTIQKIWRAFKVRKNMKQNHLEGKSSHKDSESLQRSKVDSKIDVKNRLSTSKPVSDSSESENSDSAIEKFAKAAIIIQKLWRGFKIRRNIKDNQKKKNDLKVNINATELESSKHKESPEHNAVKLTELKTDVVMLNDDKFKKAALIIQKMWRGFNTRKILRQNNAKSKEKKDHQFKPKDHSFQINKDDDNKEYIDCKQEVVKKTAIENLKSEKPEIFPGLSDPINYNKFVRAATTIQTVWRGFKVRKALRANIKQGVSSTDQMNIEHKREITGKSEEKLDKRPDTFQPDNDEFIKAAIKIQKIWRGFKVRKVLKKGDLFGTRVESSKPVIESMKTTEEINPKDKKSALKIQSLWRGYQVRKNINIIKDKLEEKTANDEGKGKELTDADIMNAATKIQAGVRGYLQRKRYKRGIINLNSIAEEDVDENYDTKKDDALSEPIPVEMTNTLDQQINKESKQLSDDEIFKALGDLNKLKIPNHIPLTNEINKPTLNRSHTVQEPDIVKKQNHSLLNSASLGEINGSKEDTEIPNIKDSNNNSSHKFTPLEMEVKEGAPNQTKTNKYKSLPATVPLNGEVGATSKLDSNSESHLVQENRNDTDFNPKNKLQIETNLDKENNKIEPVTSGENMLHETTNGTSDAEKHVGDNHDNETDKLNTNLSKTESSYNISLYENRKTELREPIKDDSIPDNNSQDLKFNDKTSTKSVDANLDQQNITKHIHHTKGDSITDLRLDKSSKSIESENQHIPPTSKTFEVSSEFVDAAKDALPNDEQASEATDDKRIYERPVSIDSTDSAITVINNELSGDNKEDVEKNETEIKNLVEDTLVTDNSNENLLVHENLINDFQNKLLDHISGKTGEEVNKKFDIEQLRKELEEAGVIYNIDNTINIQHQNEEPNAHDQLLDYLHNFKSTELDDEEELNNNASPRDLPDIKEEDSETKSLEDSRHEKENTVLDKNIKTGIDDLPNSKIDIEKLQSTLKECENIAHEINNGIKTAKTDQKPIDKETVPSEVESNIELKSHENGTDQIDCGTTFCKTPQGKTPADKCIDNRPLSDHVELLDVNANSNIVKDASSLSDKYIKLEANKPTDLSSTKETGQDSSGSGSGLLHTGELHDTVLASLPLTSETESQEPDSLENMNTELSTQDDTLCYSSLNSQLLHTGELHDTVVVPLPEKVKNDLKPKIEEQGIAHSGANNSEQLDEMQILSLPVTTENLVPEDFNSFGNKHLTSAGLLHTGELHDSLTVPMSIEAQHVVGRTNEQKEDLSSKSTKILPSEIAKSTEQNLFTNESHHEPSAPTYSGLLHTGELHDTVVVPIHGVGQCTSRIEDSESEAASNQPENTPRQVDSECQTTGEVHAVPIEVQLNQAPGVAVLTSPWPISAVHGVSSVEDDIAQTPDKGALPLESGSDFSSPSDKQSMESETRKNATINNKSMEVEAATKIQAGFRGYQVRKQLKLKNGSSDMNNQRRQSGRKSSGRITDNGKLSQNKSKNPNDIEEKSAVKIQAGIRGFLVRRRQKKQKNQES